MRLAVFSLIFFCVSVAAAQDIVKPCDLILPDGQVNSILLMRTDPEGFFDLSCRMDEKNCLPLRPDRYWEETVRVKLREAGCSMDLIQKELPGILAGHCKMGIKPACSN